MRLGTLAFLLGILLCQTLSHLPDIRWTVLLFPLIILVWKLPRYRLVFFFALGLFWAMWRADMILAQKLPPDLEGQDISITGTIIDLPVQNAYGWKFYFAPIPSRKWPNPSLMRLYWNYPTKSLRPGQQWQLTVRLKRARASINPGNSDYSKWLFQHKILATGSVRSKSEQHLLSQSSPYNIDNLRYHLAESMQKALGEHSSASLIIALALGIKRGISKTQRNTLQHTGTAHLMAISGLHIGFIAWFVFGAARWFWSFTGKAALWLPAPRFAALFSLSTAFCYALLAGFSLPTQRALIIVIVAISGIVFARKVAISHISALALLMVLLWDPLSVLSAGFWLSFGAVTVIAYALSNKREQKISPLSKWGLSTLKTQWAVTLGLFPLLLAIFGYLPLNSFLSNAIAIPWVSFWIVPLTLLGTAMILFLPTLGSILLQISADTLDFVMVSMTWLENFDGSVWQWTIPPLWTIIVAMGGIIILLLPRGFPGRWLGILWLFPLFFIPFPYPQHGQVWFTLLDVGQGLAAVVRTKNYVLVYDTGPKFSEKFNMGDAVVVPFLRTQGIRHIDKLLISHGDNDHSGGVQSILETLSVDKILTSATQKIEKIFTKIPKKLTDTKVLSCQTGQHWQWDGVDFKILHPPNDYFAKKRNDYSCVLKVSCVGGSILLPGDIEKRVEHRLVQRYQTDLKADILIAPHHGSSTSSTKHFLNAVQPSIALFSTGYRNRFKHPRKKIVQYYRHQKIDFWNTTQTGAISFRLLASGISAPNLARKEMRHYWYD
ncbi:DNA internalization-related competence protein ComEC/Rec2 [Candidatus Parabeggiatoa sp. HSG14]|uniref:DNA internalization-related competence protein ComEC/Rec2 n=1 Tax=Candidatus Parabeggiatoa sp. HSG14 TaxID=3055593 RepID=UPI0025A74422|nr:DNA internalization-related competence protein ComEC/Rec2 [Thiotrichales bacterium HSG14]